MEFIIQFIRFYFSFPLTYSFLLQKAYFPMHCYSLLYYYLHLHETGIMIKQEMGRLLYNITNRDIGLYRS